MSENGNGVQPELPDGWDVTHLEDVANEGGLFVDGDWILSEDLETGHDVRLLQLGDIGVGEFLDKSSKWISRGRYEELGCTEVKAGDVLISRMAEPLARACRVPDLGDTCITAVDVTICRVRDPRIDPDWVVLALNGPTLRLAAERLSSGTTRKRITRKKLARLALPVPPLDEQHRIVAQASALRADLDLAASALEAARQRLFDFALATRRDLLVAAGRRTRLGEVAEIRSGLAKGRKTKSATSPRFYLRAGNLGNGRLLLEEIKQIDATDAEAERFRLEEGDVLLVEGSGSSKRLGQGWVWEGQITDCLHQNHVLVARPDRTMVEPRYLAWALQGPVARAQLLSMAKTTSGLATLNKRQAASVEILLAPLEEQKATVRNLDEAESAIDRLAGEVEAAQSRANTLFRSVLRDLLGGRRLEASTAQDRISATGPAP